MGVRLYDARGRLREAAELGARRILPPIAGGSMQIYDSSGRLRTVVENTVTVNPQPLTSAADSVSRDGQNATYYVLSGSYTPASSAADFATFLPSTTLVWRLALLRLWAHQTAAGLVTFVLTGRTALDTGGTLGTAPTLRRRSGSFQAPTSSAAVYTAAPTNGAAAAPDGVIKAFLNASVPAAAATTPVIDWVVARDEPEATLPRMAISYAGLVGLGASAPLPAGFVVDGWEAVVTEGAS